MDNRGNQFVWVPIPNAIYDVVTEITNGSYTPMAVLQTNSSTNYEGIFYSFDGTTAVRSEMYNNKEPTVLSTDFITADETKGFALIKKYITGMANKTEDEIKISWTNQLQEEYNRLIRQISKYGGFWISRYEASYDVTQSNLASIAGVKSTTADETNTHTWYGLYQKIKDYSHSSNYSSSMIWGSQYDAMMNWMARNGIPVGTNATRKNISQITGNPKYPDKLNNIYDLYGCSCEWTQEAYLYGGGRHVRNPAGFNLTHSYGFETPYRTASNDSSRITLYMN